MSCPAPQSYSTGRIAAAMLCFALAFAPAFARAQTQADLPNPRLIDTLTEGSGPTERVREFALSVNAAGFQIPDTTLTTLANAMSAGHQAEVTQQAFNISLTLFEYGYGAAELVGTFGEQAAGIAAIQGVTSLMSYGAAAFAGIQVANELAQGNETGAAAEASKGVMNFVISRYGWGSLQMAGASLFVFDLTLKEWNRGVVAMGQDNWRAAYQRYYADKGRSVDDWRRRVWELYLAAERANPDSRDMTTDVFRTYLDGEINSFVNTAFNDDQSQFHEGSRTGLWSMGFNRVTAEALVAEHKTALEAMLLRDVMPEIAERAYMRQLGQLVARMNRDLRWRLNEPIRLDVTAWGAATGGEVRIVGSDGSARPGWGGPLGTDGTFSMDFTRFAWIKAGLPQRIQLETATGTQDAALTVIGDRAMAIFGEPQTSVITQMTLTELSRSCRASRYVAATREFIGSDSRDGVVAAPTSLDTAVLPSGVVIAGRYDPAAGLWTQAAPGVWRFDNTQLHFGPPYVDALAIMRDCDVSMLTEGGQVATGQCQFIRKVERIVGPELRELRCESDGRVDLAGVFADMGSGMTYYPMDGAEGQIMVDILRQSMREGVANYGPQMLQGLTGGVGGMPAMPNLQDLPAIPGQPGFTGGN